MTDTDEDDVTTAGSLRAVALERGWTYREQDARFADRWCGAPFSTWRPHRALDVVCGEHENVRVVAFRFVVAQRGGDKTSYLVAAAALRAPLPRVSLVPLHEPVDGDPYGHLFEPEDPMLSDQYQIAAVDAEATGALLHLTGVDRLRHCAPMDWRIEGSDLVAIRFDEVEFDAEEVANTIEAVATMAGGIPTEAYDGPGLAPEYPQPDERPVPAQATG